MPACHAGDRRFESGRVRHHRIYLRPVRPPGRGVLLFAGSIRAVKRAPLLVVIGLLAIAVALPITGGEIGFGSASASPSTGAAAATPGASASAIPSDRDTSGPGPSASAPAVEPSASPSAPAGHARPARGGRDRAGDPVPVHRDGHLAQGGRGRARRDEHPLRRARAGGRRDRRDPRLARRRAAVGCVAARSRRRRPRRSPRTSRSTASALAFLRADAVGPARPRAAVGRQDAVRGRPHHRPRRVAADGHAARGARRQGVRRRRDVDPVRRRRHHARPGRRPDPQDQGQGRGLPVRRRHRGHHRAATAAPRSAGTSRGSCGPGTPGRCATSSRGRTSRSPTSRTRRRTTFSYHTSGTRLLRRPEADRGARERRHRLGVVSPTTTSAMRAAPGSPRPSRTSRRTGSRPAARARTSRPRASRRCSRRTG